MANFVKKAKSAFRLMTTASGSEIKNVLLTRSGICTLLPSTRKALWRHQITSEVSHWDNCVRTMGKSSGYNLMDHYLNPDYPLQDDVAALLPEGDVPHVILDVGAGPFTYLGKTHPRFRFSIVAVDPLADKYDQILAKYSITPPIRTEKLEGERLTDRFKENTFDLAFARNCLDHSYDPEKAILQMLKVIKPGRNILLKHVPNEAVHQRYSGLHQWNFCEDSGDFIIGSKWMHTNMSRKYKDLCSIECSYEKSGALDWLVTRIRKK